VAGRCRGSEGPCKFKGYRECIDCHDAQNRQGKRRKYLPGATFITLSFLLSLSWSSSLSAVVWLSTTEYTCDFNTNGRVRILLPTRSLNRKTAASVSHGRSATQEQSSSAPREPVWYTGGGAGPTTSCNRLRLVCCIGRRCVSASVALLSLQAAWQTKSTK
jgi:hypothetical protein